MDTYLNIKLVFSAFFLQLILNAQTEITGLNDKKFPIMYDSIPIVSNAPFKNAYDAFLNNQFEKAIRYYNSYLDIYPDDPSAISNRGICYYKLLDEKRTCADFKFAAYLGYQNALINYKSFCDSNSYIFSFIDSGFVYFNSTQSQIDIKEYPDSIPAFPGGIDSLYTFIINKLGPDFFINFTGVKRERVLLNFTIDEKGNVSHPTLMFQNNLYEEEIIKMFSLMPKWRPACKNSKPIKCNYLFPVINGSGFIKESNKLYNKGVLLLNNGNLNESMSCFNSALIFNESDYEAFYNRGVCFYKMNDISNACLNWGKSYLINTNVKSKTIINKLCDSIITYNGEITKITTLDINPLSTSISPSIDRTFTVVEEMPQFPGGEAKLFMFLSNVKYPSVARENGISGRVYITFVIDKNGIIREPKVLRGIGGGCDEEALRVVKAMPAWIPGKQNGIAVNVQYNLPINFNLR